MRRRIARASLGALLAGAAFWPAAPALGGAAWHKARTGFAAPAGPLVIEREWRRALGDGALIICRRRYEVRFVADGEGYRVEGRQIAAQIEAPDKLAAMARIEEARRDDAMFPMRIDADGMIVSSAEQLDDGARHEIADLAAEMLARLPEGSEDREAAQVFVNRWLGAMTSGHWPQDLFHPAPGRRQGSRAFPDRGGGTGTVEVQIEAEGAGPAGALARFERKVVTHAAGQARETREVWRVINSG